MAEKTNIIWTEKTWNPVTGCREVSEGCKFCYAKTIAENRRGTLAFPNGFDMTLRPHKLRDPYKWKEPALVFANSMSDLFWDEIPGDYRDKIIDVIEDTPQHEYQVLTKRPEAMLEYSKRRKLPGNFWAGVTIENKRALGRLELLKQVDAEIRFVSFEPLLGDLGLDYSLEGISWAITGGESGSHMFKERWRELRGMVVYEDKKFKPDPDKTCWIENILRQCRKYNVALFHKQWGGSYPEAAGRMLDGQTYNEMPRLPGAKTEIDNAYLRKLEAQRKVA